MTGLWMGKNFMIHLAILTEIMSVIEGKWTDRNAALA